MSNNTYINYYEANFKVYIDTEDQMLKDLKSLVESRNGHFFGVKADEIDFSSAAAFFDSIGYEAFEDGYLRDNDSYDHLVERPVLSLEQCSGFSIEDFEELLFCLSPYARLGSRVEVRDDGSIDTEIFKYFFFRDRDKKVYILKDIGYLGFIKTTSDILGSQKK